MIEAFGDLPGEHGPERLLIQFRPMALAQQGQFAEMAHEAGVQQLGAYEVGVVKERQRGIVNLQREALPDQAGTVDAQIAEIADQQPGWSAGVIHDHEAVLLMGFEGDAVDQV
ncbi:hypothetical protein WJ978_25930 [Achromobacter xylosoxidans]